LRHINKHDNDKRQYFTSETQRHQSSKPRKRQTESEREVLSRQIISNNIYIPA